MAFSFDEYFDPILRQAAGEFESSVPFVLRGVYRSLSDRLVKWSLDDAVKALVERIMADYFKTDQSQLFVGFALARMSKADAQGLESAGFDVLTLLTWIDFAMQVVEWFRGRMERRPPFAAMALMAEGPQVVDGRLIEALTLEPNAEGPATTADNGAGTPAGDSES